MRKIGQIRSCQHCRKGLTYAGDGLLVFCSGSARCGFIIKGFLGIEFPKSGSIYILYAFSGLQIALARIEILLPVQIMITARFRDYSILGCLTY